MGELDWANAASAGKRRAQIRMFAAAAAVVLASFSNNTILAQGAPVATRAQIDGGVRPVAAWRGVSEFERPMWHEFVRYSDGSYRSSILNATRIAESGDIITRREPLTAHLTPVRGRRDTFQAIGSDFRFSGRPLEGGTWTARTTSGDTRSDISFQSIPVEAVTGQGLFGDAASFGAVLAACRTAPLSSLDRGIFPQTVASVVALDKVLSTHRPIATQGELSFDQIAALRREAGTLQRSLLLTDAEQNRLNAVQQRNLRSLERGGWRNGLELMRTQSVAEERIINSPQRQRARERIAQINQALADHYSAQSVTQRYQSRELIVSQGFAPLFAALNLERDSGALDTVDEVLQLERDTASIDTCIAQLGGSFGLREPMRDFLVRRMSGLIGPLTAELDAIGASGTSSQWQGRLERLTGSPSVMAALQASGASGRVSEAQTRITRLAANEEAARQAEVARQNAVRQAEAARQQAAADRAAAEAAAAQRAEEARRRASGAPSDEDLLRLYRDMHVASVAATRRAVANNPSAQVSDLRALPESAGIGVGSETTIGEAGRILFSMGYSSCTPLGRRRFRCSFTINNTFQSGQDGSFMAGMMQFNEELMTMFLGDMASGLGGRGQAQKLNTLLSRDSQSFNVIVERDAQGSLRSSELANQILRGALYEEWQRN